MKPVPPALAMTSAAMIAAMTLAFASQAKATSFTIRIENVSTGRTLQTSKGDKDAGLSPGAWCLHSGGNPMITVGEPASTMLERLAEDGNPEGLYSDLQFNSDVKAVGAFNYAVRPYPVAGFMGSQQAFEFVVENAAPGDRLSWMAMLIESNDWVYANGPGGIALFDQDGKPISGDVTGQIGLYDAGTESNEEPGVGTNQAPRQPRPDTGKDTKYPVYAIIAPRENAGKVGTDPVGSGERKWNVPKIEEVLKVTITPR